MTESGSPIVPGLDLSFLRDTDPDLLDHVQGKDAAEHDADDMSGLEKSVMFALVVLPPIGVVGAIFMLWGYGFGWPELVSMATLYVLTALGITVGFHRQLTHMSFQSPSFIRWMFSIFGSMAAQGPVLTWTSVHRIHHQHSDHEGDPHSPHAHGEGVSGLVKGMWHAHVGWLFEPKPNDLERYIPDLMQDKVLVAIDKLFIVWVGLGLALPALFVGLITQSWMGALSGFLWGGLVRLFLLHHVTWSINSVCHVWGSRDFRSHDHSTNNLIFAILGMGEGWHNNHHAFPASARHGLKWWQFDMSYIVIKTLSFVGLASKVNVPNAKRMESKRVTKVSAPVK